VTAERAQAHLAHVARITTLGEMAASIAHEVNQPLAAIVNNANACRRWMRAEPDNAEKIGASIDNIVDDANRASAIVNRVRALATRAESKRSRIEINHVVQDVLALMHVRLHESRIAVRTDLADGLPLILGDGIQLQQVVLNLVANAVDAINTATAGEREIHIQSSKFNTRGVRIRIADTGTGLDPEVTPDLFEAFYSTKPHGMGMGLSICRSIIEAHGGYIGAEPNEPHGSTFYFTLPGEKESMP
jgi:C4-dicarboxylate-specific signal transduction histidine kinase